MTDILNVRPSSIETADECLRKWAYTHVFDHLRPESPALLFGSRAHKAVEDYLKHGKPFDDRVPPSRVASYVTPYLPPKGWQSEEPVTFDAGDYKITGTIDLRWVKSGVVTVQDFKFVGKLAYAKGKEKLRFDPQFVVYGLGAMQEAGVNKIRGRWIYASKRAEKDGTHQVKPVVVEARYSDLWSTWIEKIKPVVDKARKLLHSRPEAPWQVPRAESDSPCYKYGGCPFRQSCDLATAKREAMMSDWDDMFTSAPEPKPEPSGKEDEIDKLTQAAEINPPEAADFDDPMSASEKVEDAEPESKPKPKRSRSKKTKTEPKTKARDAKYTEKSAEKGAPSKKEGRGDSYTLYLRCLPVGEPCVTAAEFLTPIFRDIEDRYALPYWSMADYGKGKGYLAEAVREKVAAGELAGKSVVLSGYTEESGAVETVLMQFADRVIIGVK